MNALNHANVGGFKPTPRLVAFWLVRALLVAWAGFWIWFNVASSMGESEGHWGHLLFAAVTALLAAAGWFWPLVGGVVMILAGMLSARFFPHPAAFTLLSAPAVVIGLLLVLVKR